MASGAKKFTAKVDERAEPTYTAACSDKQICDVIVTIEDEKESRGRCDVTTGEPTKRHQLAKFERKFFHPPRAASDVA